MNYRLSNQNYVNFLRMEHTTFIELLENVTPYIKEEQRYEK